MIDIKELAARFKLHKLTLSHSTVTGKFAGIEFTRKHGKHLTLEFFYKKDVGGWVKVRHESGPSGKVFQNSFEMHTNELTYTLLKYMSPEEVTAFGLTDYMTPVGIARALRAK